MLIIFTISHAYFTKISEKLFYEPKLLKNRFVKPEPEPNPENPVQP